jgi:hypothetical protein
MPFAKSGTDRIALWRQVLEGWEAMGGPLGTPAETLRLIEGEIAILATLREQAPIEVDDRVRRYGRLAEACRARVN